MNNTGDRNKDGQYRTRFWPRLLVAVVTFIAMLLLAELGLRAVAITLDKERGATFDPETGWRLVAGISKLDPQWCDKVPATTNADGWRDEEFTLDKPENVTRIIALGDSFTFGFGVDYGQRFSEVLEANMPRLEVLNMGVFAYGTDQEFRAYQVFGRQYRPDIVILNVSLGTDLEDLRMKEIHSWPKPYFLLDNDRLTLRKPEQSWTVFARKHSYIIELLLNVIEGGKLYTTVADELKDADVVELFYAILGRLDDAVRADNARLLVVLHHPHDASGTERLTNAGIARGITERRYDVLDLFEAFSVRTGQGEVLYLEDGHLSPAGHALVARMIQADLLSRGWLKR